MRVFRSILLAIIFIAGVFIASANVHLVELVVFPDLRIAALPDKITLELPLFLIVIATLGGGVLLGGLAAGLEHVRLRHGLRRARKERDRALEEQGKADALLDGVRSEADGLRAQIAELTAELAASHGGVDESLSPFVEARPEPDVEEAGSVAGAAAGPHRDDSETETTDTSSGGQAPVRSND